MYSAPKVLWLPCRIAKDAVTVLSPLVKVAENEAGRRSWVAPRRPRETITGWDSYPLEEEEKKEPWFLFPDWIHVC